MPSTKKRADDPSVRRTQRRAGRVAQTARTGGCWRRSAAETVPRPPSPQQPGDDRGRYRPARCHRCCAGWSRTSGCSPWTSHSRPGPAKPALYRAVGGWWNRQFAPEVDLVGADRRPVARRIQFVGSIKWLGSRFDPHDLMSLISDASQVPGFTAGETGVAVVSRSGIALGPHQPPVDLVWGPEDLLSAWWAG